MRAPSSARPREDAAMPYDLVIKNGTVIDGSGLPRYRADVGVSRGRIATIGRIRESAREVLDAECHIVAPGFVDGHTHMDAQIFWDPLGTSSCYHGITTVVMGNCGFTLAPCAAKDKHLVVRNLQRAEDIPPAAMGAGIKWSWTTFPEFLDALEALPKGINYAGYVGHSAIRNAGWDEVRRLVGAMGELNAGIFEIAGEGVDRKAGDPGVREWHTRRQGDGRQRRDPAPRW
ncbi:MAG: amidohydrolase family protein [Betaproteobacteria bacterium]|nr:amidohydrolase family protein [Betaproteobacteria bacterium]